MPRTQTDYGLPVLSFDEAARVLGVEKGPFMTWLVETLAPSPAQWSFWKNGKRPLPEVVIRLYLTQHGTESTLHRELRELAQEVSRIQATLATGVKRGTITP